MKNEFTPAPGWLAEDVERAQGVYRSADEIAKMLGCPRDPRFGCSKCGADWMDACRRRTSGEFKPDAHCVVRQLAKLTEHCQRQIQLLAHLTAERDAARFEAARARGEAHAANLALKELRKKRNAECRALGRVLMIARDVLEPATKNQGNV